MNVVYVITKKNFRDNTSEIIKIYGPSAKQSAKDAVDLLNANVLDDDDIDYILESYDVIN